MTELETGSENHETAEENFSRQSIVWIALCTIGLIFMVTSGAFKSKRPEVTILKSSGNVNSFDAIELDPSSLAPIIMRSDVVDYGSYSRAFLKKFGLDVPDSAKRSKGTVFTSSATAGWAYVSIYNSSTCSATAPIEYGGMLSGSCVNTGTNSSYFILCSSDSIDIYRYSEKDCLSVYKTRSIAKGCQEGIEANFDDWLIDNGVDDETNDDTTQWSMNFECTTTTTSLPLTDGSFATYEAFYTGASVEDDGTCTDAVMFEAWPLETCIPTHSDNATSSCMFIDDNDSLGFCLWNTNDCPSSCDKPKFGPTTCFYDTDHGDMLTLWGINTYDAS